MIVHRDAQTSLFVPLNHLIRQSGRLFSENEKDILGWVRIVKVRVGLLPEFCNEEKLCLRISVQKLLNALMIRNINVLPIIKACTLEHFIISGKSKRFD